MTTTQLQFLLAFAQASHLGDDPTCDILHAWNHLSRFLAPYDGNGDSACSWYDAGADAGQVAGEFYLQAKGAPLTVDWAEWQLANNLRPPSRLHSSAAQFNQSSPPSIGWGSR
jgi:hypothetical protein